MLKPALPYQTNLTNCFATASLDPRNRFFADTFWRFIGCENDDWSKHQFVSVDNFDDIVGYFEVTIERTCHFVHSLNSIRFLRVKKYDILFAKDFKKLFLLLFCHYKYNKINFDVCVGSPHEPMYNKFVENYGG